MIQPLDVRLKAQNNGTSWRDCEHSPRRRHSLGPAVEIHGATIRRCRRCPVSIYSRSGRG